MKFDSLLSDAFGRPRLLYGGDYNPEQWPKEIWREDANLMDLAHWNVATIGVFSWAALEPEPGKFDFGWLDEVMELLANGGRRVILATPSAAPPAWMSASYPEIRRVGADGVRARHGNRVNFCWTSPVYRELTRDMSRRLAERYGAHPALMLWHVSNEYGGACHCNLCQNAFRLWLQEKFGSSLDRLNQAYWTRFWSHSYSDWSQIEIPGAPHGELSIQGLSVDWRRFVSDQIIDFFLNESGPLREISPEIPITTNMMGTYDGLDLWKIAPHVDLASWDSYPAFDSSLEDPECWQVVAFKHDLTRSLKRKPFFLMECTPGSSNWYSEMALKRPGRHVFEGLHAIAYGSDGVGYFQWRQSRGSQEKFHGGVVSHEGSEKTRIFQEVAALGEELNGLHEIGGTRTVSQVAIVYDWENGWAIQASCGPRQKGMGYGEACRRQYGAFYEANISVDFVPSDGPFDTYRLIVLPMLYMLKEGVAERIERFVRNGGTVVMTYWSGIVDENDLCFTGGFPGGSQGPLRDVFGIWDEEIDVLPESRKVSLLYDGDEFEAETFCSVVHLRGAEAIGWYGSEFYAGSPAITCNRFGKGEAYFVASRNDVRFHAAFYGKLCRDLGIKPDWPGQLPSEVVARKRVGPEAEYLFLLNPAPISKYLQIEERGLKDAITGESVYGSVDLPGPSVRVLVRSLARTAVESR